MARVVARNHFAARLKDAVIADLKRAGIHASVDTQPIRGTRLHRVYVVAKQFGKLRPTERQDLIWRIVDQHLKPDEQLRISMILTVTPAEWRGD